MFNLQSLQVEVYMAEIVGKKSFAPVKNLKQKKYKQKHIYFYNRILKYICLFLIIV